MNKRITNRTDWARRHPPIGGTTFELKAWFFMRISGLLLVLLAVTHMFVRAFDWVLLSLSLLHGGNGLRIVLHDNISNPTVKKASLNFLFLITLFLFFLGSYGILTFVSQI